MPQRGQSDGPDGDERHDALSNGQRKPAHAHLELLGVAHLDDGGRWLNVSDRLCALLGYRREQLLQLGLRDVLQVSGEGEARNAFPVQIDAFAAHTQSVQCVRGDGSTVSAQWTTVPLKHVGVDTAHMLAVVDVRDDRPGESVSTLNALADPSPAHAGDAPSAARIDALLATSPDYLWTASRDDDGPASVVSWSPVAGRQSPVIFGHDWFETLHPDDRAETARLWQTALRAGEMFNAEFRVRRTDGEYRWMRSHGEPQFTEADGSVRYVGVQLDITTERARFVALQEREAYAHKLLGVVAHDLRNPLNTIAVSTEALRLMRTDAGDAGTMLLDAVTRATHRADELVAIVLDFAGAALSGGLVVTRRPMNLRALVNECVDDTRLRHPDRDITFRARPGQAEEAEPYVGMWDAARLQQVAGNLLSNAIAHGLPRGAIHVTLDAVGDRVYLEISNASVTIPADRLATLFDPIHRRPSPGGVGSGLGLGLYIVQQLVHAHGGRVWATSASRRTIVTVELPRESDQQHPAFQSAAPNLAPSSNAAHTSSRRSIPGYTWHIRDTQVRGLLLAWLDAATLQSLPSTDDLLAGEVRAWSQDMCRVAVTEAGSTEGWRFTFLEVGAALERRLGQPLTGIQIAAGDPTEDETLREWIKDYARAAQMGEPVYGYLQVNRDVPQADQRNGSAEHAGPLRIERLVVPCSEARGTTVTHLLSIVRFIGIDTHTTPDGAFLPITE